MSDIRLYSNVKIKNTTNKDIENCIFQVVDVESNGNDVAVWARLSGLSKSEELLTFMEQIANLELVANAYDKQGAIVPLISIYED